MRPFIVKRFMMPLDLDQMPRDAQSPLRRRLRSRTPREARRRRLRRHFQLASRRVRRPAAVFAAIAALLIIYSLMVSPTGFFIWLPSLPTGE